MISSTFADAIQAEEATTLPAPASATAAAIEASEVDVITMHGHFTLTNARVPPGEPAPEGSVLTVVVDAHTGELEARGVSEEEDSGLAALGKATVLK